MDKVICDICGTEYPESEAQCPICGCAKIESVIPQNQAAQEEESVVSERRGARFSKSNVNRRMRSSSVNTNSDQDHDYVPEEDDEDEEDQPPRSNIVLIGIVIVLLLAIIAVSTYIAVSFFGGNNDRPGASSTPSSSVQKPKVPCTDFQVSTSGLTLESLGQVYNINIIRFPMNTTDTPIYKTSDPAVAVVAGNGQVTAMGEGTAVITITCGNIEKSFTVSCVFESVPPTTAPTVQPTTKPTVGPSTNTTTRPTTGPAAPTGDYTIMIDNYRSKYTNEEGTYVEATIKVGEKHSLTVVDGNKVRQDVTWSLSKDGVCTLSGNTFKGAAKGTVLIKATLNGVEYICKVIVTN